MNRELMLRLSKLNNMNVKYIKNKFSCANIFQALNGLYSFCYRGHGGKYDNKGKIESTSLIV